MAYKPTRTEAGWTLVETLVAAALGSVVMLAAYTVFFYSNRSFAALINHVELERSNGHALDLLTQQIRQANQLIDYSPTSLTLEDYDGQTLQFVYDPLQRTLSRIKHGEGTTVYLADCDSLQFQIYKRTVQPGTLDVATTADDNTGNAIAVTWGSSRSILGTSLNTESVQSAKVVIRKN